MATGRPSTTASSAPATTSFALNPLTTTFSRPQDCTGVYQSLGLAMMDVQTTCLPDGFKSQSESYFSPGLVCPSGYVSACHDNTGVASQTTVTCCPTLKSDVTLSCVTTSTLKSVWSTLFCTWIAPSQKTSLPVTVSGNGVTSTEMRELRSPAGLNAFGVRMVYQKTDLEATTKTGSTKRPDAGPTSSAGPRPSPSASSGLSTGAKVAIGVVVPLVVLAILAGVLLWWWRRRRRQRAPGGPLYKYEKTGPQPHAELHGEHVQEMVGSTVPVELPATGPQK
ncbi:Uncharacterized protein TPAR_06999 [Tolypocladium paradoxum]|uniref:Mid2 domain-containing protein n=1 Tax=Tolypocladium paradoxum TaxID=94208 RepID=A0A2S4KRJ3_9HYPO|nr:Uncharacterized protein TPAR_06999 [Tolypocladium paradoxum]